MRAGKVVQWTDFVIGNNMHSVKLQCLVAKYVIKHVNYSRANQANLLFVYYTCVNGMHAVITKKKKKSDYYNQHFRTYILINAGIKLC